MSEKEDPKPVAADDAMLALKRCMAEAGGRTAIVDVDGGVLVSWESGSRTIQGQGLSIETICAHRWFQCSEDGVWLSERELPG